MTGSVRWLVKEVLCLGVVFGVLYGMGCGKSASPLRNAATADDPAYRTDRALRAIVSVSFVDDSQVIVGVNDGSIVLLDTAHDLRASSFGWHPGELEEMVVSNKGDVVATVGGNGRPKIVLWEVGTHTKKGTIFTAAFRIMALALSPNSAILAHGDNMGVVTLLDADTTVFLKQFGVGGSEIYGVDYSADGEILATSNAEGKLTIWEIESGKKRIVIDSPESIVTQIKVGPKGDVLYTGSETGSGVNMWSLATGKLLGKLDGTESGCNALAVSRDGREIVAGLANNVHLWRLDEDEHFVVGEHLGKVTSVAIRKAAQLIVSGDESGAIRIWDVRARKLRGEWKTSEYETRK